MVEPRTVRALWREGEALLRERGVESPKFDAAELLCHGAGFPRGELPLHLRDELSADAARRVRALFVRRARREPLQYLLGCWAFYGHPFRVGEGVLIPRPDTECLVEAVLARAPQGPCTIADLCSGSGCIAVALGAALPQSRVLAVEKSGRAFGYLQANIRLNGAANVWPVRGDALTYQGVCPPLDVLVANPPYIRPEEMETLSPEVLAEPREALEAPERGLAFYRHFAAAYRPVLRPGGLLAVEIGCGQGSEVCALFRGQGYEEVTCLQDLGGLDRVVLGRRPK